MKKSPESVPPPKRHLAKEEAKSEILSLFKKSSRPLIIGAASMHLGYYWTLEKTERLFEELIEDGKMRALTQKECEQYDLTQAYVLVSSTAR